MIRQITAMLIAVPLAAAPSWFRGFRTASHELMGYGEDISLQKARDDAYADIAAQRGITIDRESLDVMVVKDGELSRGFSQRTGIRVHDRLEGIRIFEEAKQSGHWYVAACLDIRPFALRLSEYLDKNFTEQPPKGYLAHTPLMHQIAQTFGKTPRCGLSGIERGYILSCAGVTQPLRRYEVGDLFYSAQKGALRLDAEYRHYRSGDRMQFQLSSRTPGFATLFVVEEGGKTAVVQTDLPVGTHTVYPNDGSYLQTYNPGPESVRELYVALFSPAKLHITDFTVVATALLGSIDYQLHRLIALMERYDYATMRVTIAQEEQ